MKNSPENRYKDKNEQNNPTLKSEKYLAKKMENLADIKRVKEKNRKAKKKINLNF